MIKRVANLLMVLLLIAPLVAHADMIIEPENDFYKRHQSQIIYLGRSFAANGEGGSVSVKKAPGLKGDMVSLQNGTITYIQYSCLYDGDFWGFTLEYSGWVKLDQMLVLYDYVAFEEDNFDNLYLYNGDYAEIKKAKAAIAWPWPGSDAPLWTIENLDAENFRVSYAYIDAEGREWGFATYLYGSRNIWVCLSQPLNRDIPAFIPAPEPGLWESETLHTDIGQEKNELPLLVVVISLVTILVMGTAVLIRVAWKPNTAKTEYEKE